MSVEVYGMIVSANVSPAVFLVTDAKCGKYVMKNMMEGECKTEEYLAINPWGQIPAMKDGDLCIGESGAILRYIAQKYAPDAYGGDDIAMKAKIDFALDYTSTNLGAKGYKALWYPIAGFGSPPEDMDAAIKECTESLEKFCNTFLKDCTFVGGDKLSIADYKFGIFMWNFNHPAIGATGFKLSERLVKYVADWEAALSAESKAMLTDGPMSPGGFLDGKLAPAA